MDLIDRLRELALRIPGQRDHLKTEEATKNALVMPFINALGYNVFDPTEVVPEFTADVGTKKGEKVDYAIVLDGAPVILFECKWIGANLDDAHASQLYRYFSVTSARFGVLTNGTEYRFFSDLEAPNKMDSRPFLVVDIENIDEKQADELKKFTKQAFDLEKILTTASDLKYLRGIKRLFGEEWANPTEEFMRLFAGRVYSGRLTQNAREQFTRIVKRAFHEFVNDRINERIQSALSRSDGIESEGDAENESEDTSEIVTTEEELQGFYIVKAIVSQVVQAERVFMRDTKSYCGILLDDNNRRPICRLCFNSKQKYLDIFDEQKNRSRVPISSVEEIYEHAESLRSCVKGYL